MRANKALLAPYASKNKDAVPAHFRDPDDHWIGTNVHLLVILQNTKLIPADAGPKSWADLMKPEWKGKIAFTDPANSGSAYSNLTMLAQMWGGGEAGWEKVSGLLANTRVLNRSSLVFQGVGNGEFALGMSLEYAGYQWSSNGAPVKVIYPADGTVAQMEGVAIIKGGPNTENAKQFVDYVSRKDVREAILRFRIPPAGAAGSRPFEIAGRDAAAFRGEARRLRRGRLGGEARRNRAEDSGHHPAHALTVARFA